jgi:2-haloacid dehalogenase
VARVSFDLNGTLLDPRERADALDLAVQLAMAHTLAGEFPPFADLLRAAGSEPPDELPPFEEVEETLARLASAGHTLIALTNSSRETAELHLERAGLRYLFHEVAGADQAGAYKPDARVYGLVDSDWHVAAHWWDVLGAARAGRRTVYVARREQLPAHLTADLVVDDLEGLDPRRLT